MVYYFVRGERLYRYNPATSASEKVSEEPVTAATVGPKGMVIYATPDKKVGTDY